LLLLLLMLPMLLVLLAWGALLLLMELHCLPLPLQHLQALPADWLLLVLLMLAVLLAWCTLLLLVVLRRLPQPALLQQQQGRPADPRQQLHQQLRLWLLLRLPKLPHVLMLQLLQQH
jgi:hypothetical protein